MENTVAQLYVFVLPRKKIRLRERDKKSGRTKIIKGPLRTGKNLKKSIRDSKKNLENFFVRLCLNHCVNKRLKLNSKTIWR